MRIVDAAILAAALLVHGRATPADSTPGVPNFYRVNDHLFRGGQPTAEGSRTLAKLGVKTVLNLRTPNRMSASEAKDVRAAGMRYVEVPLDGKETPPRSHIERALSILGDRSQWPVFVHCHAGKDRTGMLVACYRIRDEGWTNQRALFEAKARADRDLTPAMEAYILRFRPNDPKLDLPIRTVQPFD